MRRKSIVSAAFSFSLIAGLLPGDAAASDRFQPPDTVQFHLDEGESKRQQLDSAVDQGKAARKNWAPTPEPSPIDVLHYDLDLFVDPDREVVSGTVELEFSAVDDGIASLALDTDQALRVLTVMMVADGRFPYDSPRSLPFTHEDDRLQIALPRALSTGETMRLSISYGGHASRGGLGVIWSSQPGGGRSIFTFAEPFGARLWFPCSDRPDDKATVDLTVTAPNDLIVASNGLERWRIENPDGTATTKWSSLYPVATYLVVMNISDFDYSEISYEALDGSTMPVVTYAYPLVSAQAELDLANTPEMIEVMAGHFGEYPFVEEKYGNCTTNFGGGMEHQTLTTIGWSTIGGSWIEWLNVHELGHQWWGDWVTCDDWRELWLNEGFATYTEFLWAEHQGPAVLAQYVRDADWAGLFLGALYDNPVPFSRTIYDKGGWVVRMLRHVLGDEDFFAGIAAYRALRPAGSATTEDLRAAMESASGMELGWFFDQWVYGKNRPRYQYAWEELAGPVLRLTVWQKHSNAELFRMPIDVQVTTTAGTEDHRVWVEAQPEQTIDIALSASPTNVVLDPDHKLLCELGPASDPDLDLGPDYPELDAGQIFAGQSSTITVPMTNVGGSDLVISAITPLSGSGFQITAPEQFPLTLEPGASAELEIRFLSSSPGLRSSWFAILSNDPSRNGETLVYVQGRSAIFELPRFQAQATASAGQVRVGGVGDAAITVNNYGAAPLFLSAIVTGDDFSLGTPFPAEVPAASALSVFVRFSPTAVGDRSGTLSFGTNDPTKPQHDVRLSGLGLGAPRLDVSPSPISFGIVEDGAARTIALANSGSDDLVVSGVEIDPPFAMAKALSLPATIPPGGEGDLEIGLQAGAGGNVRGMLRILSNDPAVPRASIPVSAHQTSGEVFTSYFPAAAKTTGLGGADWKSRAFLVNPTDQPIAVDLDFRPTGGRTTAPPDAGVWLPAQAQRVVPDMVGALGSEGAGGVGLTLSGPGLIAVSRTFSSESTGSYGQYIPSIEASAALTGGSEYLLAGLAANGGYHTNFGILNLADVPAEVDFEVHGPDGIILGTRRLSAVEGTFAQAVNAVAGMTGAELRGGYAVVRAIDSGALFGAYASVVDDGSHDPTFISPITVGASAMMDLVLPAVAATAGLNQTRWASDLTVVNLGDSGAEIDIDFYSSEDVSVQTQSFTVDSGAAVHLPNVVGSSFGSEGSGWLRLSSPSEDIFASSRTYNDHPAGTFGQFIPAVESDDLVLTGETVVLAGLSSEEGFRTNLGITSLAETDTTIMVRFFQDDGGLIGELSIEAPAGQFHQLDRVLADRLEFTGTAWATLWSDDTEARFIAHASVVDGSSGDPVYIPATRVVAQ